jgi:endonuclease-3
MDWNVALRPLIEKYRGRPHPLAYQNLYQLVVMVLLSAQDSDVHINSLAPELFLAFPTMDRLAQASQAELTALLHTVRNYQTKTVWLVSLAQKVGTDSAFPQSHAELVKLPGIGPKSANVILREAGRPAEGIIVDLHVLRVAPRLGVALGTDATKIEKQLKAVLDKELWGEAGMALSFLGRETCRPTRPRCPECVLNAICPSRE